MSRGNESDFSLKGEKWDISFLPNRLRLILEEAGFEREPTVRTWRDRGWLDADEKGGKIQKHVRLDGENPRQYVIKREAIKHLVEEEE